ncbi:MAG TPA: 2'-5' RNA ligase family protein [Terriglobales bacterium]|nr:2'-5' RNA ligase family protein [Terriglobales bacterium]
MKQTPRYGLIAYVKTPVGEFVENLRQEMHPELPHLAAHLSLLPPRCLQGSEASALETMSEICGRVEPFEVSLGEVETFIPVTATVFVRVANGAQRMRDLHAQLNIKELTFEEQWLYLPHLTIVKMSNEEQAQKAYYIARQHWSKFEGTRCITVKDLTFVREVDQNRWIDIAPVPLGGHLVKR